MPSANSMASSPEQLCLSHLSVPTTVETLQQRLFLSLHEGILAPSGGHWVRGPHDGPAAPKTDQAQLWAHTSLSSCFRFSFFHPIYTSFMLLLFFSIKYTVSFAIMRLETSEALSEARNKQGFTMILCRLITEGYTIKSEESQECQ